MDKYPPEEIEAGDIVNIVCQCQACMALSGKDFEVISAVNEGFDVSVQGNRMYFPKSLLQKVQCKGELFEIFIEDSP